VGKSHRSPTAAKKVKSAQIDSNIASNNCAEGIALKAIAGYSHLQLREAQF
jgi:hypothetical protein